MRKIKSTLALLLMVIMLVAAISPAAYAATVENATIDFSKTASLSIYKFDFTNAKKDGKWSKDSFVSTGHYEQTVNDALLTSKREGDSDTTSALGNGQSSNGYAIKGVEFTYLRVADICQYTETVEETATALVLYAFNKTDAADLMTAIGLTDANAYEFASLNPEFDTTKYNYYTTDTINMVLDKALSENSTKSRESMQHSMRLSVTCTSCRTTMKTSRSASLTVRQTHNQRAAKVARYFLVGYQKLTDLEKSKHPSIHYTGSASCPNSDAAVYKLWGNGVALPNVTYVLAGIVHYATMDAT